nr:unnamed protein product [Digitaria exilis]
MVLRVRLLPRLLLLPSTHTSTPLRPSRLPRRLSFSARFSALSHLAVPQDVEQSDNEGAPHGDVQVKLPLDRLFVPPGATVDVGDQEAVSARVLKGSNIVLGPYARGDAHVVNADFVKSSVRPDDCPRDGLPEFALVGRSNVGKSSLLNSLVRRKRLALTSKKPDASIPAKKIDLDYASWLGQNKVPMTLVFTKCDKRKKKKNGGRRPEENVETFQGLIREYFEAAPPWIMTSSVTNQGRDEILLHMSQLRNYWLKH